MKKTGEEDLTQDSSFSGTNMHLQMHPTANCVNGSCPSDPAQIVVQEIRGQNPRGRRIASWFVYAIYTNRSRLEVAITAAEFRKVEREITDAVVDSGFLFMAKLSQKACCKDMESISASLSI